MAAALLTVVGSASACDSSSGDTTPPKLTDVQAKVFAGSCAISGCHGSGSSPSGNLKLSDAATSHASLVNQEGTVVDEDGKVWLRVVPGQPEQSLLYRVLKGKVGTVRQMPPGVALPADQVELVRAWIAAGAKND
jgi:hypothetical protein